MAIFNSGGFGSSRVLARGGSDLPGRACSALVIALCFGLLAGCGASLNPALENGIPITEQNAFGPTSSAGASTALPGGIPTTVDQSQAGQAFTSKSGVSGLVAAAAAKGTPLPVATENVALVSPPNSSAYRIGPQDVLEVSVFKVPDLNRIVQVADSGTVNLPLVNEIVAVGRTPQELERDLTAKLGAKYLQSPQVTVNVKEFNSQRVTVEGAVKTPGVYPIKGKSTLLQVMAYAGGVDSSIATNDIVVFRSREGKRFAAKYELSAIRSGNAEDPMLLAGDVVVVNTSDVKSGFNNFLKILPVAGLFALL